MAGRRLVNAGPLDSGQTHILTSPVKKDRLKPSINAIYVLSVNSRPPLASGDSWPEHSRCSRELAQEILERRWKQSDLLSLGQGVCSVVPFVSVVAENSSCVCVLCCWSFELQAQAW